MTTTTYHILEESVSIILDPARWTVGTFARDDYGAQCTATSRVACSWCALGIVDFITYKLTRTMPINRDGLRTDATEYLNKAVSILFGPSYSIAKVNDDLGWNAVIRMYALALKIVSGEEIDEEEERAAVGSPTRPS